MRRDVPICDNEETFASLSPLHMQGYACLQEGAVGPCHVHPAFAGYSQNSPVTGRQASGFPACAGVLLPSHSKVVHLIDSYGGFPCIRRGIPQTDEMRANLRRLPCMRRGFPSWSPSFSSSVSLTLHLQGCSTSKPSARRPTHSSPCTRRDHSRRIRSP